MNNNLIYSLAIATSILTFGESANACVAKGIYLDRDSTDLVIWAVNDQYDQKTQDFKNEINEYRNQVTLNGIDEGVGQVTFSISFNENSATLVATSPSGNVIPNPYGKSGLVFEAVGIPKNWNLARAVYEVLVKNTCTWK